MTMTRRDLLAGAALASPLWLTRLDAEVTPDIVGFRPEIEFLVHEIERTPREKCAEMAVDQLRRGVSYREFLAALFLAGIRNVNPRPPGFALHCVFVIHSAHQLSLEAPPDARLLPLFYALDNFKTAQLRDSKQSAGDYTMRRIRGPLPSGDRAAAELTEAMESWDSERAEKAAVSLARHQGSDGAFSLLWRYGARDYRNIGHKAIYVANAHRTLQTIGWDHAEPVLRSLVLSLLDFGKEQQMNGYALDDQCYAGNRTRVRETFAKLGARWALAASEEEHVRSILGTLRTATPGEACEDVAGRLVRGPATAGAAWDALRLASAELRMRAQSGAVIGGLHAVTAVNALHHAYLSAPAPEDRYLLLLQAVGWTAQFRTWMASREGNLRTFPITDLKPALRTGEMWSEISSKPDEAAGRILSLARNMEARRRFLSEILRQTITKADEVHYYKYLAALLEEIPQASLVWQAHLLSAIAYYAKGASDPEPAAMKQAREALRAIG